MQKTSLHKEKQALGTIAACYALRKQILKGEDSGAIWDWVKQDNMECTFLRLEILRIFFLSINICGRFATHCTGEKACKVILIYLINLYFYL